MPHPKNQNTVNQLPVLFATLFLCWLMPTPAMAAPYPRESPVVQAVGKVSKAVVNIGSEYEVQGRQNPFSGLGGNPFFDSFFKDFFDPGIERRTKRNSLGSGVIIDGKRGFILTNAHVIAQTGIITVTLKDEREFKAQIVGADPDSDLAVLQILSDQPLPAVAMGNSDDIMIGETVIAIGNPFGFSHTVTTGVVSATNRSVKTEDAVYHNFIQTDASINPGNSGGPLLNINGELIGINTAIYSKAQGIGFAIPINKAKRVISDLIQYGEVVPAWLGIVVQDMDERLARYLKLPESKGLLVKEVEKGSPAQTAGILEGDVLLALQDRNLASAEDYHTFLKDFSAGDTVTLKIRRSGGIRNFSLQTAVFPLALSMDLADRLLGIKVEDITARSRVTYHIGAAKGVFISQINRQSYLAGIGVRQGDVIRQIDQVTINDSQDFQRAIVKYRSKKSMVLLVQRGDQGYYITVKL
ncbi:MAG: Do family serine endopeptidase [Desulfobacterales bacterium]|nr:Do family serine endopeptidase [Desulfobacterales bacterium]